jgi:hypothetical protein
MSYRGNQAKKGKAFFFEKKEAKNFCRFGCGLSGEARPKMQKFFGSFFQKRTASFTRLSYAVLLHRLT